MHVNYLFEHLICTINETSLETISLCSNLTHTVFRQFLCYWLIRKKCIDGKIKRFKEQHKINTNKTKLNIRKR